jgi:hypothetical protein
MTREQRRSSGIACRKPPSTHHDFDHPDLANDRRVLLEHALARG